MQSKTSCCCKKCAQEELRICIVWKKGRNPVKDRFDHWLHRFIYFILFFFHILFTHPYMHIDFTDWIIQPSFYFGTKWINSSTQPQHFSRKPVIHYMFWFDQDIDTFLYEMCSFSFGLLHYLSIILWCIAINNFLGLIYFIWSLSHLFCMHYWMPVCMRTCVCVCAYMYEGEQNLCTHLSLPDIEEIIGCLWCTWL